MDEGTASVPTADADELEGEETAEWPEPEARQPGEDRRGPLNAWMRDRILRDADVLEARPLRGRPVMDLSQGRQAGTVADVVLDPEGERIVGLSVAPSGGLPALGKQGFLPFYRLRAIGDDAVTVDHADWLEPQLSHEAAAATAPGRALEGKRAVTRGGDIIGVMQDAVFNRADGRIAAYRLDGLNGDRLFLLWTRGVNVGEDFVIVPDEAPDYLLRDRGGPGATWEAYRRQGMEESPMETGNIPADEPETTTADLNTEPGTSLSEADERLDNEFQYVIGHYAHRDVVVDGQVVVPAGTEVTAADAAAALAAGALEDLAFAVGAGDYSKMDVHGRPDHVEQAPDSPANDPDATV